jgi:hypothetical protein
VNILDENPAIPLQTYLTIHQFKSKTQKREANNVSPDNSMAVKTKE